MKDLCHKDEMLADYMEGRLSDLERSQMEGHLSSCETCMQTLILGNSLVRGGNQPNLEDVPERVTERAVRLFHNRNVTHTTNPLRQKLQKVHDILYNTLFDFFNMWKQRQLAPVRGSKQVISKDLMRLKKCFKEIETEIEIEKTGKLNSIIRVILLDDLKGSKDVRVTLRKENEREVSSQLLNGRGAVFENTPFGHYQLVFIRDGQELGIYRFVIKEMPHGR